MRVFAVAAALSVMLASGPTYSQAPAQTAPRPVAPAAQAPAPQPAPAPNVPFPAGVKYGYVNLEAVYGQSAEGQKIQSLIQSKQNELQGRQKALQDAHAPPTPINARSTLIASWPTTYSGKVSGETNRLPRFRA